jgi:hypothetical protein
VLPYWFEWWCRLFGYGSCRSIPMSDAFLLWGATALALIGILFLLINWLLNKIN